MNTRIQTNTYGMRRTLENKKVELDAEETTLEQHSPNIPRVGQEPEEDFLYEIIREFNEHWFKGWEATPAEQKARLELITKEVVEDEEYNEFIVGNPDTRAVNVKLFEIIGKIMRQQRKGDMTLYAKYMQEEFKSKLNQVVISAIEHYSKAAV